MGGENTAIRKKPATSRRPRIAHEEVYARLKKALIEGELEPGRSLSLRNLGAQYSMSAMPAREAIRRLVGLGALEMTRTRRIAVAQMTRARAEELGEARAALEASLAVRALRKTAGASRARKALVDKLTRIDEQLDAAIRDGDPALYSKMNSAFHFTLYSAAKSVVLLDIVEGLWLQIGPFMRIVVARVGAAEIVDQHKEAIAALAAGDAAKLESAIRLDIMEGMSTIAEYCEKK